jgi:hypothetical protein
MNTLTVVGLVLVAIGGGSFLWDSLHPSRLDNHPSLTFLGFLISAGEVGLAALGLLLVVVGHLL